MQLISVATHGTVFSFLGDFPSRFLFLLNSPVQLVFAQGNSISNNMSARKQADLLEAFNTFDEDKSGFIDLQELIRCLR